MSHASIQNNVSSGVSMQLVKVGGPNTVWESGNDREVMVGRLEGPHPLGHANGVGGLIERIAISTCLK